MCCTFLTSTCLFLPYFSLCCKVFVSLFWLFLCLAARSAEGAEPGKVTIVDIQGESGIEGTMNALDSIKDDNTVETSEGVYDKLVFPSRSNQSINNRSLPVFVYFVYKTSKIVEINCMYVDCTDIIYKLTFWVIQRTQTMFVGVVALR